MNPMRWYNAIMSSLVFQRPSNDHGLSLSNTYEPVMDSFQSNEPDIAQITLLVEHPVLNLGVASHRSLPLVAYAPHLELHQLPNRSIVS